MISKREFSVIQNLQIDRAAERSIENRPGFQSHQSFNFGGHYRENRDGWGALRVFNDDFVADNTGIPLHPHANFEILSVILAGEMSHEDNLGNQILVHRDEVKHMSAGSGLMHGGTCYHGTNFLQIWIEPNVLHSAPTISKKKFNPEDRISKWQLQASPNPSEQALQIKQEMYVYRGTFKKGDSIHFEAHPGASIFIMPLEGSCSIEEQLLHRRDTAQFKTNHGFKLNILADSDLWLMVQPQD